jgi:aspartate carbamoyltransferase catalytic subunit
MAFNPKHILTIKELSAADITFILDTAESFKEINTRQIKKVPVLRGKTIVNLFFEASTRTRTSFEIAGKRLSADTINISASSSSVVKGETLEDTAKNIEAMHPDIIVMRHSASGACDYLARRLSCSVINAGDGTHEHPSQALLDAFTIRQHKGQDCRSDGDHCRGYHPQPGGALEYLLPDQTRRQSAGCRTANHAAAGPRKTWL